MFLLAGNPGLARIRPDTCKDVLRFAHDEAGLSEAHRAIIERLAKVARAQHRKLGFAISTTVSIPEAIRRSRMASLHTVLEQVRRDGVVVVVSRSADLFFTADIYVTACEF